MRRGTRLTLVRRRRAAMLLWYMLVAFPFLVVCGILGIEYQRILTANRVTAQVTDAAAAGAVLQLVPSDGSVSENDYAALGCGRDDRTPGVRNPDLYPMCLYVEGQGVSVPSMESVEVVARGVASSYTTAVSDREGANLTIISTTPTITVTQAYYDSTGTLKPAEVQVQLKYKVPSVGFMALGRVFGLPGGDTEYQVRSRAQVCVPGYGETAGGECVRNS